MAPSRSKALGGTLLPALEVIRLGVPRRIRSIITVCSGVAATLLGVVVLLGWMLEIQALKSVLSGFATMKPNTALCFALSGFALSVTQMRSGWWRRLALGCAAVVLAIGLVTLLEYLTGRDFRIDQWLVIDGSGSALGSHPRRMAAMTCVGFILTSLLLGLRLLPSKLPSYELIALIEGIHWRRRKGSRDNVTRWTPRLRALVDDALAQPSTIASIFVLHDRYGQAITEYALDSAWDRLMAKLQKENVQMFTYHSLKAKGISDAKDKRIGGHRTQRMIDVYNRKLDEVDPAG